VEVQQKERNGDGSRDSMALHFTAFRFNGLAGAFALALGSASLPDGIRWAQKTRCHSPKLSLFREKKAANVGAFHRP
jgi:hypothetical protein